MEASKFPLGGRIVAITGAASGIGRAAAKIAARSGAKVLALDINEVLLASLKDEIYRDGGTVMTESADITNIDNVRNLIGRAENNLGTIDGLVCSAGISIESPFLELSPDLWDRIIQLNLTSTFYMAQAVARGIVESGLSGSIVTISSAQGVNGRIHGAHYSASKAGVIGLTKSMALELATHKIRVNCVAPGAVQTPLMRSVVAAAVGGEGRSLARIPLGRFGQPDDVAAAICFLLSDLSDWVTGQTFHINGGSLMV